VRFSLSGQATVPASGSVTVTLNGPPAWWKYDLTTVVCTVGKNGQTFPECDVYRGWVADSQLLGHSRSADNVTFNAAPGDVLMPGDFLIVIFTAALVGSLAVVNAFGEQVKL